MAVVTSLISKIQTILEGMSKVKKIYSYPATKIEGYPAVLFFMDGIDNTFESTGTNFKEYRFKLFLVIGANQQNLSDVYERIMPNAIDQFLDEFDDGWNFQTIDNHRVWQRISTGLIQTSESQDGLEVSAEFDLVVKMLTDVN